MVTVPGPAISASRLVDKQEHKGLPWKVPIINTAANLAIVNSSFTGRAPSGQSVLKEHNVMGPSG